MRFISLHSDYIKFKPLKKALKNPEELSEKRKAEILVSESLVIMIAVEKKDELVIYCPLLDKKYDTAESALNFLKHTNHGLWVGINNGTNAAIAAVEILNFNDRFMKKLAAYRKEIGKRVLDANW